MRTVSQTFTNTWDIGIAGRYFRLLAAAYDVDISFFLNGQSVYVATAVGAGFWAKPDAGFDRIQITYAGTQTVKVGISNGDGGYDSSNATITGTVATTVTNIPHVIVDTLPNVSIGNVPHVIHDSGSTTVVTGTVATLATLGTTITDTAAVSVLNTATVLLAANAARRGVRVLNNGTATVYIGGSAVSTSNGCVALAPGQMWFEDTAPGAAWYGISGTSGQDVRIQVVS